MDSQQADREDCGAGFLNPTVEGSEGTQDQGAQAEEAQEALSMLADYNAMLAQQRKLSGTKNWRNANPDLLSLRRFKMRQAAVVRIKGQSQAQWPEKQDSDDFIDSDAWNVTACDCGACDELLYQCCICITKHGYHDTIFHTVRNNQVCISCFDYYFTMLQLEGADG